MPSSPKRFHGWPLVAVGWLLYGLSVAPFYSWGFFMPEMLEELSPFALFFGRHAFATTTGIRFIIGAILAAVMPAVAGRVYDSGGSYAPAFLGLAAWTLMAAAIAMIIRPPVRRTSGGTAAV